MATFGPFDFAQRRPITGDPRLDADTWSNILRGGPRYAQTYGGLQSEVARIGGAEAQARQASNMTRGGGMFPGLPSGGGQFSTFRGIPGGAGVPTSPTNPFTTISNVKNPSIQSAIDSMLNGVRGLSSDPNTNLNVVRANTKSQAIGSQIAGATNRFEADVNDSRQSFTDFVNAFRSSLPQAQANLESDTGALDEFYDNGPAGVRGQLDRMAQDRATATTQAARRAMQMSQARNNFNRLVGGNSSYLDRQLNDSMGDISTRAVGERADLQRNNLLTVKDAQARLSGQRNTLLDSYLQRFLTPAFARQQLAGNELGQLGQLTNLDQANNFYQLDSPEQMMLRRLGILGGISNLDQSNNFYGVQRPYEQDIGGYRPVGGGRGGGSPSYSLPNFSDYDLGYSGQPNIGPSRLPNGIPSWVESERNRTGFGDVGMWPGMSSSDRAAAEYQQVSGANPRTDPNFSNQLWENSLGGPGYSDRLDADYEWNYA